MRSMWLNVNFNINPPTQWSCCYPGFIRLIIRKWKRCYPSPACWGTQLHVSAWSQPYPSSFMTTAKPWQQKPALQHTDLRCSSYQNKLWHSAFCSCAPPFASLITVLLMWRVQCSSPTVPACLCTQNSAFLSLSPPDVESASCSTALNLFYPVCVASLFLEIHSCGCLELHRRKNLLELPPASQAVLQAKVRSSFLELSVLQFHTLSCGTIRGGKNPDTFYLNMCL